MRKQNAYYDDKFTSVQTLLSKVEDERSKFLNENETTKKKLDQTEKHLKMREGEVSTLQQRVQDLISKHNVDLRELKTDNAALTSELNRAKENITQYESREVEFQVLRREKEESDRKGRDAIERNETMRRNHERTVESLNASLSTLKRLHKEHEITERNHQEKLKTAEKFRIDQVKKLKAEISDLKKSKSLHKTEFENSLNEKASEMDQLVEDHKTSVSLLGEEIDRLKKKAVMDIQQLEDKSTELMSERDELRQLLDSKDRECNELQNNLKIMQKDLAISKSDVEQVKELSSKEQEVLGRKIDDLEAKNQQLEGLTNQLNADHSSLEKEMADIKRRHAEEYKRMESRQTNLHEELIGSKMVNKDLEHNNRRLHSRTTELSDKVKKMEQLDTCNREKIQELKAELSMIIKAQNSAKESHKNELQNMKAQSDTLRAEIASKDKVINELNDTKRALDERKEILQNMVTQNRQLNDDYAEARTLVSELQEEMDGYLRDKACAIRKASHLEKQLGEKESSFRADLDERDSIITTLKLQLSKAEKHLVEKHKKEKEYGEMEKENDKLKDKIKRQEAFLKKKLQQDRTLRQSSIVNNKLKPFPQFSNQRKLSEGTTNSFDIYNEESVLDN